MADFRPVDDGREMAAADAALIGNGEGAALQFFQRNFAVARFGGHFVQLPSRASAMSFLSTSRRTGTIKPCSVSTAMPM